MVPAEHSKALMPSQPEEGNRRRDPKENWQRLFAASAVTETGSRKMHRELLFGMLNLWNNASRRILIHMVGALLRCCNRRSETSRASKEKASLCALLDPNNNLRMDQWALVGISSNVRRVRGMLQYLGDDASGPFSVLQTGKAPRPSAAQQSSVGGT